MKQVAIVGGGVSGLSAAYYLGRKGVASKLFEKRSRLGGTILTERLDGCLLEAGADSWLAEKTWMLDLARDLGIGSQVIGSNDSRRRTFVVRGGRLVPLPESMRLLAPSKPWQIATTPLLGLPAKMRFAVEWFRRPAEHGDRSVADFVRDHFGDEAVEYIAQPMLAGVYGSPPERLSANQVIPRFVDYERTHGSILRGVFANRQRNPPNPLFLTLRDGMGSLVAALEHAVSGTCEIVHDEVMRLERSVNGWHLHCAERSAVADTVVLATPAHEAGAQYNRLHLVSRRRVGVSGIGIRPSAGRVRTAGSSQGRELPGRLHLGQHQVRGPGARRQGAAARVPHGKCGRPLPASQSRLDRRES